MTDEPLNLKIMIYSARQDESGMETERKVIEVVGGIIRRGGKFLLGRRDEYADVRRAE
jgi:hypothetical protein